MGYGTLVGSITGKVIAFGMKNLYCKVCVQFLQNGKVNNKDSRYPEHHCTRNFENSPGNMEAVIVVEMLEHLLTKNVIVDQLVQDGDSSVMALIGERNLYRHLMVTVDKIFCYLHLTRNFSNKMMEIEKSCNELKALGFAAAMKKSLRGIIKKYNDLLSEGGGLDTLIPRMEKELRNLPDHILRNHKECGSYCDRTAIETPVIINDKIKTKILQHLGDLISKSRSLILRLNTNRNEQCNAVVNRAVGAKRVHFGNGESCYPRLVLLLLFLKYSIPYVQMLKLDLIFLVSRPLKCKS